MTGSNSQEVYTSITHNPADRLQTFHVTLLDEQTGERVKSVTHDYSIEGCALSTKENLISGYSVIKVEQPDTKTFLNSSDISEL